MSRWSVGLFAVWVAACAGDGGKSDEGTDLSDLTDETDVEETDETDAETDDPGPTDDEPTDGEDTDVAGIDADADGFDRDVDCDDSNPAVNPGAVEVTGNSRDEDCDRSFACFVDADGDGFGSATVSAGPDIRCDEAGYAAASTDCDDGDAAINPDAGEPLGDGVDQDCDGRERCFIDLDDDGFGRDDAEWSEDLSCDHSGLAAAGGDCDDGDDAVRPDATEAPIDGVDADCDGFELCHADVDGDGWGADALILGDAACAGEGVARDAGDCDDSSALTSPDGDEVTNDGVDDDCDGLERCPTDGDGDGWGGASSGLTPVLTCEAAGYAVRSGDCADDDAARSPGAEEAVADGVDSDCDGEERCYLDTDQDGSGSALTFGSPGLACTDLGFSADAEDCDDDDDARHPGASEAAADGVDSDCDGLEACYADVDRDGAGAALTTSASIACAGDAIAAVGGDCDDDDADRRPGAEEQVADLVDSDCDGSELCWADNDADGFGASATALGPIGEACAGAGVAAVSGDCDDGEAAASPDGTEVAGGEIDEDCNGEIACYVDGDSDGFAGDAVVSVAGASCAAGGAFETSADCDDDDLDVRPGAVELLNGVDDDCDASTTEVGRAEFVGDDGSFVDVAAAFAAGGAVVLDVPGTLRFAEGEFTGAVFAQAAVDIVGAGEGLTVWRGGGATWIQATPALADVSLTDLTVQGPAGGASFSGAALTLTRVTLTGLSESIVAEDAAVTLTDVTVSATDTTHGAFDLSGGTLVVENLNATDTVGTTASVARLRQILGQVTFAGGTFDNITGSAFVIEGGDTRFEESEFTFFSGDQGGAIRATGAEVSLAGAQLFGGNGTGDGGAIWSDGGGLTLTDVVAISNNTTGDGGLIWAQDAIVTIEGGSFNGTTGRNGGLVYALDSQVVVHGAYVADAYAYVLPDTGDGGAFHLDGGYLELFDVGGYFCLGADGGFALIRDGSFLFDEADIGGITSGRGAVRWTVSDGSTYTGTIQNSQLNSNTASSGGAVVDVDVASGSATLTLADSTVLSNTSEGWRALALTTTGGSLSAQVNGVSFSGNQAGSIWISAAPGTFSLTSQMSDFADATDVILANLPLSFTVETVAFTCNATGCAGQ